jgi:hypothetical protein
MSQPTYDLVELRKKLRQTLVIHQVRLPAVSKGCGLSTAVLGKFLEDGPLDDQQALYLHSWLYYQREATERTVEKLVTRSGPVSYVERIQAYEKELRRYGVRWKLDKAFQYFSEPKRRILVLHMDDRCKLELLKLNAQVIRRFRIVFHDGQSYWQWLAILRKNENREAVKAWRAGFEAPGHSYNNPPVDLPRARRPTHRLRWRTPP